MDSIFIELQNTGDAIAAYRAFGQSAMCSPSPPLFSCRSLTIIIATHVALPNALLRLLGN